MGLAHSNGPDKPGNSTPTIAAQGSMLTWQVPVTATPASILPAWAPGTTYVLGQAVTNDSGKVYRCRTAGTSAGSGGPTGTTADITDNTAHWQYVADSTTCKGSVVLRTLSTSTNAVYYGDANLTATNGAELPPGQSEPVFVADPSGIYVATASSTATLTAIAYR